MFRTFVTILLISTFAIAADRNVSLTIYNQSMAVVKEIREVNVENNRIVLDDVAGQIDRTSVKLDLSSGRVLEQNYEYDLINFDKIIHRYENDSIGIWSYHADTKTYDTLRVKLIHYNNNMPSVCSKYGKLFFMQIGNYNFVYPDDVSEYYFTPTLIWKVDNVNQGKQNAELTYITKGITWTAEYIAVLAPGGNSLDINCWVDVENNTGATYRNAKMKLMAGDLHQAPTYATDRMYSEGYASMSAPSSPMFQQRNLYEYYLYELQGLTSIADKEDKQIALLEAKHVPYVSKYSYQAYQGNEKVTINIMFENSKSSNLDRPMPAGRFRFFQSEADGNREYIGEDRIDHTPSGREINLTTGNAFDITGKTTLVSNRQISTSIQEYDYKVQLFNAKMEPVKVEVVVAKNGVWSILQSDVSFKNRDAYRKYTIVEIPARGETTLYYTVHVVSN